MERGLGLEDQILMAMIRQTAAISKDWVSIHIPVS